MIKLILLIMILGILFFASKNTEINDNNQKAITSNNFNKSNEYNDEFNEEEINNINKIIAYFKERNIDKIANIISYPLGREYPIPYIDNKSEFKQRFNEVFDQILIDKIANSKINQWSKVGWRGIMLDNGVIWMRNSDSIITTINYQSDFEKRLLEDLIQKDKEKIHYSLKSFSMPIYKIKTKNYLIRIDQLDDDSYRYASWRKNGKENLKPEIILYNGNLKFEGSGGNHVIIFCLNNFKYYVYINEIGCDETPEALLEIEKDGKIILDEEGDLIVE